MMMKIIKKFKQKIKLNKLLFIIKIINSSYSNIKNNNNYVKILFKLIIYFNFQKQIILTLNN